VGTRPSRFRYDARRAAAPVTLRQRIDRAVHTLGTDLSSFVVRQVVRAAREVLADRTQFALSEEARAEWERVNRRPAREQPGLQRLMERPSPFSD